MADEVTPLLSKAKAANNANTQLANDKLKNNAQSAANHPQLVQKGYKYFQNPITGSTEQLAQITDYMPIPETDTDLESLVGSYGQDNTGRLHQHDRDCNLDVINRARRQYIRRAVVYASVVVYLAVFGLELFGILEVPFGFIMAGLLAVGGTIGYVQKGSLPSIIAGLVFAFIFLIAGTFTWNKNSTGYKVGLGASVLLFVTGFKRSYLSRFTNYVPIIILFLGLMSTGYYLLKYYILKW